jgi:hypothetical protein
VDYVDVLLGQELISNRDGSFCKSLRRTTKRSDALLSLLLEHDVHKNRHTFSSLQRHAILSANFFSSTLNLGVTKHPFRRLLRSVIIGVLSLISFSLFAIAESTSRQSLENSGSCFFRVSQKLRSTYSNCRKSAIDSDINLSSMVSIVLVRI